MVHLVSQLRLRLYTSLIYKPRILHGILSHPGPIRTSRSLSFARHQGPLRVRRVRIRRRWLTWKKLATLVLGTGLSLVVTSITIGALAIGIDDSDDVDLAKQQLEQVVQGGKMNFEGEKELVVHEKKRDVGVSGQDDKENPEADFPEDTPEGAWFIPLGFAKKLPPRYYSNDDIEWQAFIEFAEDKARQSRIKAELCSMVLKTLSQHKGVEKALGKGLKCKSYWLDVDYPSGPPPEYERYGIEWSDDYIALLHRPVNSMQVKRIEKALWPTAVITSACSTLQEIAQFQYDRLRRALGISANGKAAYIERRKSTDSQISPDSNGSSTQVSDRSTDATKGKPTRAANLDSPLHLLPNYLPGDRSIIPGLTLFRRELSKRWRPALSSPPAGSVFLQGLIEYRGSVATCTVDVAAAYVTTERKWHVVLVSIKRIQPNVQWPRGSNQRT